MCTPTQVMCEARYSTIPDDLSGLFDHIQVEAAMRNKLDWLENKVREFLKNKPAYNEMSKFLVATQDEILGAGAGGGSRKHSARSLPVSERKHGQEVDQGRLVCL